MGVLVAHTRPSVSAFPETTIGSACTSSFSRFAQRSLTLRPAHSRGHQIRDRYPKASDISSPPCLPRLLPAGAVAGWALHPLEMRRLVTAHAGSGPFCPCVIGRPHRPSRLEREYPLPVGLHTYDDPRVLDCLIVERLSEGADLGVGKALRGTVGIFALRVVMQHEHRKPRAVAALRVFEHLLVAGRIAEGCARTAADHQMDAFRLARVVVVQEQLRLLGQDWLAVLAVAV